MAKPKLRHYVQVIRKYDSKVITVGPLTSEASAKKIEQDYKRMFGKKLINYNIHVFTDGEWEGTI